VQRGIISHMLSGSDKFELDALAILKDDEHTPDARETPFFRPPDARETPFFRLASQHPHFRFLTSPTLAHALLEMTRMRLI